MKSTFNLSEFRTVEAEFGETISIVSVDSRVPENPFKATSLKLEEYNERVEFLREHDHIFGMNMAKEKFCK
ncbi:hypothetical protein [Cellvibrio sp. UBA7671]|uniref:hypothetical protein n=1 Tax=Cellvibrio sp. UBA7671 TaxID=1946312 RepID=UPI002F3504D1